VAWLGGSRLAGADCPARPLGESSAGVAENRGGYRWLTVGAGAPYDPRPGPGEDGPGRAGGVIGTIDAPRPGGISYVRGPVAAPAVAICAARGWRGG